MDALKTCGSSTLRVRIVAARTAMEWRKGFLDSDDDVTARRSRHQKKKVAEALPDEAFLPAETYDLGDDDEEGAADPRVAALETSEEAHQYSVDHCRAHCSAYNKGLIKLDPEVTLSFCSDVRALQSVCTHLACYRPLAGPALPACLVACTSHSAVA